MNYEDLKGSIRAVVKQNGNKEITGELLQQALLAIINSLGAGFQYMGVATPATQFGQPDSKQFYLATQAGQYSTIAQLDGTQVAIFVFTTAWSAILLDVPTLASIQWEEGEDNGAIQSKGTGAHAVGVGSLAHGAFEDEYGTIEATGDGSIADGFVGTGASISALGSGSSAKGFVENEGIIEATGNGAQASGAAIYGGTGPGYITAYGIGSLAHGYSEGGVALEARGRGAVALGFAGWDVDYYHASIASGDGSLVAGVSNTAQNVGEIGVGVYNKSHKKEDGTDEENKAGSTQFSVGVGYYDYEDGIVEQNAIEIMQNGDVYVMGIGGYDGKNAADAGIKTLQQVIAEIQAAI